MKYKIEITGGAGFIGALLTRHPMKNFQVKILDVTTSPKNLEEAVN
jgi:nucleoside-diphosphate-sugar epimerase